MQGQPYQSHCAPKGLSLMWVWNSNELETCVHLLYEIQAKQTW